jgi:hypothetical protein
LEADVAVFGCFGSNQQSFNCLLGSRHPGVQSVDLLESPHSGVLPSLFQLTDALGCGPGGDQAWSAAAQQWRHSTRRVRSITMSQKPNWHA